MGLAVLVLGFSGSGKSASLRNFGADELTLINVNGKPLPFRTRFTHTIRSDRYPEIMQCIRTAKTKSIAVDDTQYLMANEFMRRSKETGFQKFTDIAKNFWELVRAVEGLPDDVVVYFLSHIETGEDGRQKAKTIGKLLDEKITVEGMFTIVLKTVVADGKYLFATQTDGTDTCKTPIGLFDRQYIDNDLKIVDEAIRGYYGFMPSQHCDECGAEIMSDGKRTVQQIADGSLKVYGKKLCMECVRKRVSTSAAATVSK